MLNFVSNLVIIAFLFLVASLMVELHNNPPQVEAKQVKCNCKELPKDYFVVTTKEQEMCVDYTGETKVYKEIESAKVIK